MTNLDTQTPERVWIPGADTSEAEHPVALGGGSWSSVHAVVAAPAGTAVPRVGVTTLGGGAIQLDIEPQGAGSFRLTVLAPTVDARTFWRPGSTAAHAEVPPSWADGARNAPFDGIGLGALLGPEDRVVLAYAADAGEHEVRVRAGLVEETAEFMVSIEAPEGTGPVSVRLVPAGAPFAAAVSGLADWLSRDIVRAGAESESPVFCTWYFAHQDVEAAELIAQGKQAGELGFGTMIIDDGWQTGELSRGYGSCGDWSSDPEKIGDSAALVSALERVGIKTMWWIGTPFIGHRSAAFGAGIPLLYDEPKMDASILDPRSPAARAHLVERISALMRTSGSHGVKIDFLERFAAGSDVPAPEDADAATPSDGGIALIREIRAAAEAERPGAMIEYREPYISPTVTRHATMIRVGDCPLSPSQNRLGTIDLRLASPRVAVHADPIMWSAADSPERVAQHLLNALFGVPQVSVDLLTLDEQHREVLAFWIGFWRDNVDTILHGEFLPSRPELLYPLVEARGASDIVIARYAPVAVSLPATGWTSVAVANADEPGVTLLSEEPIDADYVIHDARGRRVGGGRLAAFIAGGLDVPTGGLLTVTR